MWALLLAGLACLVSQCEPFSTDSPEASIAMAKHFCHFLNYTSNCEPALDEVYEGLRAAVLECSNCSVWPSGGGCAASLAPVLSERPCGLSTVEQRSACLRAKLEALHTERAHRGDGKVLSRCELIVPTEHSYDQELEVDVGSIPASHQHAAKCCDEVAGSDDECWDQCGRYVALPLAPGGLFQELAFKPRCPRLLYRDVFNCFKEPESFLRRLAARRVAERRSRAEKAAAFLHALNATAQMNTDR